MSSRTTSVSNPSHQYVSAEPSRRQWNGTLTPPPRRIYCRRPRKRSRRSLPSSRTPRAACPRLRAQPSRSSTLRTLSLLARTPRTRSSAVRTGSGGAARMSSRTRVVNLSVAKDARATIAAPTGGPIALIPLPSGGDATGARRLSPDTSRDLAGIPNIPICTEQRRGHSLSTPSCPPGATRPASNLRTSSMRSALTSSSVPAAPAALCSDLQSVRVPTDGIPS